MKIISISSLLMFAALCLNSQYIFAQTNNHKPIDSQQVPIVQIVVGGHGGVYSRLGQDLANAINGDRLRVSPVLGEGSIRNLLDLLDRKGIDLAIIQKDAINVLKNDPNIKNLDDKVSIVADLHPESLHVLSNKSINNIKDLMSSQVSYGLEGSGARITLTTILNALNIQPTYITDTVEGSIEKVKKGEISAFGYVSGKGSEVFKKITETDNVHFLEIPLPSSLSNIYSSSLLTKNDYPNLIQENNVATISTQAVLVAHKSISNAQRTKNIESFIKYFKACLPKLQRNPGFSNVHWRSVQFASSGQTPPSLVPNVVSQVHCPTGN